MSSSSETNATPTTRECLNCGHSFEGRYCPKCGQDADQRLRPLAAAVREVIDSFGAFDFKFLFTLRLLLTAPGRVTRDVLDGKRQRYTPALRLYVVMSAISVAAMSLSGLVAFDSMFQDLDATQLSELQQLTGVDDLEDAAFRERLDRRFNTLFPIFNLLTPFGLAIALKLVIPRTLFQAHAVSALHLGTAQVAYSSLMIPAFLLGRLGLTLFMGALMVGIVVYSWLLLQRVYGGSAMATALRCLALAATYLIVGSLISSLTAFAVFATA